MTKLFITDIDGCLTQPFKTPDWDSISQIRNLNRRSRQSDTIPPLSICSGRPLPYVEAVAQWMDIHQPVIFESGGLYTLSSNRIQLNGVFDEEARDEVSALKEWMNETIVAKHPEAMVEFSKMMDAGIVHPEKAVIDEIYPEIREYVQDRFNRFEVHVTDVSVNVILKENNKRRGIELLCRSVGINPSETAYIGDSSGDIPGLTIAGRSFAPANADDRAKDVVDEVIGEEATEAVLKAYRLVSADGVTK